MPARRVPLDLHALSGHVELFRISGSAKRDASVERWLVGEPTELRSLAKQWFTRMRRCGDDVREGMHDGCPVACVEDAPFCYVDSFTRHVNVGFFYGAMLEDASDLLEGAGKRMRHVKLKADREVDVAALGNLITAAYLDLKARLAAERDSTTG
ncbi:hypothetical protein HNQ60_001792 [Povalibacter uvarum]|uniref:YdhG-like domain-containing protein n=1 Tax=Povalibacter uvarum TaxID=732238 RepID=A0A841HK10_9GAMM|nr:DUF1801 domain-containing protein [Povalibacter uvarum]MBB6092914.1 hypothetical protein [Povalibacter uvarum]